MFKSALLKQNYLKKMCGIAFPVTLFRNTVVTCEKVEVKNH